TELAFVHKHAIPVSSLLFPVQLPFGKRMFFKQVMCFYSKQCFASFKTYPAFYPDNGISYMYIAPYSIGRSNVSECLNGFVRCIESLVIYAYQFSFFESERDSLFTIFL